MNVPELTKKPGLTFRSTMFFLRRVSVATLAVLVISVTGFALTRSIKNEHKEEIAVIESLSTLQYPAQSSTAETLCTQTGKRVLPGLVSESGSFIPSHFEIVNVKANPRMADIEMISDTAEGKSRIFVRVVNQNGWKFEDVLVVERHGKKVNLWESKRLDSPVLSFIKTSHNELIAGTKEVLSLANDIADTIKAFQNLSQPTQKPDTSVEQSDADADETLRAIADLANNSE